jgi:hypothetical protein
MRMNPTDLGDVSGAAYTYLANGMSPAANWTAIARPGERVRLRVINGSATTIFDVRIPGLKMTVVSADGQDVEPVAVDEFRISVAETYDVIVQLPDERAYTIFAQSIDRSGYARATLAPRAGMAAPCRRWTRKPGFPWSTWEWAVCTAWKAWKVTTCPAIQASLMHRNAACKGMIWRKCGMVNRNTARRACRGTVWETCTACSMIISRRRSRCQAMARRPETA